MSNFGAARAVNSAFNFDTPNLNLSLNASPLQSPGFAFGSPTSAPLLTTVEAASGVEQLQTRPDWMTWYSGYSSTHYHYNDSFNSFATFQIHYY